ncbi:protein FAM234A [Sinocyclocheilus grahami]|uniref:Protein FAM234A-like n=1 Tax=Sinocyclocheilus grahami TaxID=75366 RepID=A0A672RVJ6_SINGR|nr:PREDICTED: protein FAM234A-like [Sinocyclocheilus grahami]XP_016100977.1 PREDICTED: protein FAM234A-like [Sinocyclocheilus grahami]XP_016100978.1 PREDICTED: protein FAM234A-like [Sinocyclocheilus grahami]XP_016100979.1 PREDICTED: protein FAM234A-like [Sinocyclocheilus grahami]XP_016100980.1 PREDICTED: protein FAM234A-like [Sinocyclocheilus grahami]
MADASGSGFEAEPLKGGEAEGGVSKKKSCTEKLGFSHLTGWRTAAFLFSLFLCLAVVFAFSFILPCPVRPQYFSTWNRTLPDAATYDFLAVEDANEDKVLDVLFIYKDSEASRNTCLSEDLSIPCLVLTAVDGTDGKMLWERPLAAEFDWVECGVKGLGRQGTGCLVAHADNLTAIDKKTGVIRWQQSRSSVLNGNLPLISIQDLNADKADDFAILSYNPEAPSFTPIPSELVFFSGKSGDQIGSKANVDWNGVFGHQQFKTASGAPYLLLLTKSGLYAVSLRHLTELAGLESALKEEKSWKEKSDKTGLISLYQSDSLKRVMVVPGSSSPSLLVQTDSSVSLLHTDKLKIAWSTNTSTLLSVPTFGQFDKDGIPDIMIEEDIGNKTKRVLVLSGSSGVVLWEVHLLFWTPSPRPASVLTLNTYSVFMLWGQSQSRGNQTNEMHSSFLLHPRYSQLLLERRNPAQNIISFKATLLERGRHAGYLVLTGPDGRQHADLGETEPVILTKRKIKEDVPESAVLRVGADESAVEEAEVKEAFYRLRFSETQ